MMGVWGPWHQSPAFPIATVVGRGVTVCSDNLLSCLIFLFYCYFLLYFWCHWHTSDLLKYSWTSSTLWFNGQVKNATCSQCCGKPRSYEMPQKKRCVMCWTSVGLHLSLCSVCSVTRAAKAWEAALARHSSLYCAFLLLHTGFICFEERHFHSLSLGIGRQRRNIDRCVLLTGSRSMKCF